METSKLQRAVLALALILLMTTTRFHHFGSALHLPDASLAVFFLAGFYARAWLLPLLLIQAAAIDYVAINAGGVSDWCVTPAYPFLAAAYGAVWLAGRWYAGRHELAWRSLLPLTGAAVTGTLAAFLISNASFYLLSGYFGELSATEYAARVARYLPPYLSGTLSWLAVAAVGHLLLTTALGRRAQANA